MLFLDLLCASISKMCSKVIAFSCHAISACERFHRNNLLLDSGGNLYYKKKVTILKGDCRFQCGQSSS